MQDKQLNPRIMKLSMSVKTFILLTSEFFKFQKYYNTVKKIKL